MRNWLRNLWIARSSSRKSALDPLDADLPPMPSERSTGLVFAAVAGIVAAYFHNETIVAALALSVATVFAGLALAVPNLLTPLNRAWFALALLLNRIVSPVVMFVLFAGLIVPAGIVMQMRRDPLRAARDDDAESYWIVRPPSARSGSMRDQF